MFLIQGDSGGPLVFIADGVATVLGVVSYGRGCGRPGFYGVYTQVFHFVQWINTILSVRKAINPEILSDSPILKTLFFSRTFVRRPFVELDGEVEFRVLDLNKPKKSKPCR